MGQPTVLNVDDYLPGRYARTRVLRDAGFEVIEAASGEEALRLVRSRRPDVVLLDHNLPDTTGLEVCRAIKQSPETEAIPVLQISAVSRGVENKVEAMNVGADTYLTEPIAPAELVAHVQAALRWRRAEERLRESNERMSALYEEAQRANRAKDDFLAVLSHELRTPLNAMLGWIQLLRTERLSGEQRLRAVEIVERNAFAQARLIEDLLDVSRIVTGQLVIETQPVEIGTILREAIDTVKPAAHEKALVLDVSIDSEPAVVIGDRHRLQQVITNLLSNAVKFTERGTVEIRLQRQAARIFLGVRDTGIGIDPSFLPFVFDRFRQADSSRARPHGGLGLGLAISRHIVEAHGGRITAESGGRDLGATFVVELPEATQADIDEAGADGGNRATDPERPLHGVRLLLVEDDADSREMMTLLLEQAGAEVTPTSNAAAALQALEELRPDVMLADVGLPHMDGHALVRKMRERGMGTPAVALTGYATPSDRRQALDAGFNDHLGKPVEPDALVDVLSRVMRR